MTRSLGILAVAACLHSAASLPAADLKGWVDAEVENLRPLYEHLHSHPELSFAEHETSKRIAEELRAAGCEVTTGIAGTGLVGLLKNGDGPTIMFRTDLDALPLIEETGLPFASQVITKNVDGTQTGVMHACGHDLHMTNLVGLARLLNGHRDQWSGTAMFLGQLAEERGNGALRMLEAGLFTKFPKPQFALALHVDSDRPAGEIGWREGYTLANTDSCDIIVRGRGGHGSRPEQCIDPIAQAAQLIVDLQTIVSREISPLEPAVITVGSIHGGTKHNIIANECRLQLTVRSYTPEVRAHLHAAIRRKAKAVAESFRAPEPTVEFDEGTPALLNDDALVARIVPTFGEVLGDEHVKRSERVMGGEDFSFYGLAGVPIFMFRLGTVEPVAFAKAKRDGVLLPTLHSSTYAPDFKTSLRTGLLTSGAAMLSLMPRTSK